MHWESEDHFSYCFYAILLNETAKKKEKNEQKFLFSSKDVNIFIAQSVDICLQKFQNKISM